MDDMFSAVQAAADRTNAFNAEQAQINRDFQERMSNTAIRRQMTDLKAAGLNPILAARQGASTPSGSQASGADASGSIAGLFGQLVSAQSAMAVAMQNNASAKVIEEMRERHDRYIHEKFPSGVVPAVAAIIDAITNPDNSAGKGIAGSATSAFKFLKQNAPAAGSKLLQANNSASAAIRKFFGFRPFGSSGDPSKDSNLEAFIKSLFGLY